MAVEAEARGGGIELGITIADLCMKVWVPPQAFMNGPSYRPDGAPARFVPTGNTSGSKWERSQDLGNYLIELRWGIT
jgi:hypothetical protein